MKKITLYLLVFVACMVALASAAAEHHHHQHHDHEQTPTTPHHHWPWWLSVPWWRRVPPPPPSNVHHPLPPRDHHHNYSPSRPAPPAAAARFSGDCSTALIYTDGCTRDLITSFFDEEKISVGGACCRTISGLSDDCFQEAFTQFKSPRFTRAVRDFCAHRHLN